MLRLQNEIREVRELIQISDKQTQASLQALQYDSDTRQSPYNNLLHALRVEKGVCDSLRRCELERSGSSMLQCQVWLPAGEEAALRAALTAGVAATGGQAAVVDFLSAEQAMPTYGAPPTWFPTTKFSAPYQMIVRTTHLDATHRCGAVQGTRMAHLLLPSLLCVARWTRTVCLATKR